MSEGGSPSQPLADLPAAAEKTRPSWFEALARLWCLKAVDGEPRGSPVVSILLLSASWLTAWILIDRWQRQPDPEFYVDGIPLLGWYALAILGLAGLLRRISNPRPALGATLVLALGLAPPPLLLVAVAAYYLEPPWYWYASGAVALYVFVYLMRGLRACTGRSQRAAALIGVVFIVAFIGLSDALDAVPDVWNPREAASAAADGRVTERETALFEQADRIDEALEAVHRDGAAGAQAFFLGFAGVGEQKVFAQEIELAARVVGKRFGAGERQLSLINDERDLERAPLASVSGLTYALQGLASRMDLNKDVLFLAISSHGASDPAIAVSNSQFPFEDLTRPTLADVLQASGIKWRVLIISACYAGGFIDSLRDPRTIVIAAAAADRTSFGCSNDSDLTYFGEAFYRDALPGARSLREAFETAKATIAARERREHVTPSDPQAYFGSDMEAKLAAMSPSAQ
ncbi:MAG: C13 family peptidase [Pseudomonadota bacterium]|nr:C13 family peptidase [Pseudomonadota bacterium]